MATVDQEVFRTERVATLAQQRVGLLAIVIMWNLFQSVNPLRATQTYQTWFFQSLRIATAAAYMIQAISLSQYRLARALDAFETYSLDGQTGTIPLGALRQDLIDAVEDAMSLGGAGEGLPEDDDIALFNELVSELREEFAEMAERLIEKETRSADAVRDLAGHDNPDRESLERVRDRMDELLDEMLEDPSTDDGWLIEIVLPPDDVGLDPDEVRRAFEENRRDLEESVRKAYIEEIENVLESRFTERYKIEDAYDDIRRIADKAGLDAAAYLERLAKERGQAVVERLAAKDNKLLLAARRTGPNPCAFCAMLAARGYVYTGTTAAGSSRGNKKRDGSLIDTSQGAWDTGIDGVRRYHANCQCSVVYRWQESDSTESVSSHLAALYEAAGSRTEFRNLLDRMRRENGGSLNLY